VRLPQPRGRGTHHRAYRLGRAPCNGAPEHACKSHD
jgi:hypothetical protein